MSAIAIALTIDDGLSSMPVVIGKVRDRALVLQTIKAAIRDADQRARNHRQPYLALAASAERATLREMYREASEQ